jgi:hypothetical protein
VSGDLRLPAIVPTDSNTTRPDANRHADLGPSEPFRLLAEWRRANLETDPDAFDE